MTAERVTVPAARTASGRTFVVLPDTDAGVWTLDHDGASYWPGGADELRRFGTELEAGIRDAIDHPRAFADAGAASARLTAELADLDGVYELLATIADELEGARADDRPRD